MNNDLTTFFKHLKGIRLSQNERLQLRERLAAYADMHPALAAGSTSRIPLFAFFASRRFSAYAALVMVFVVAGGGVTLAADVSAPGDALYAVKINVNEPLMTALAPTNVGQAKVAARLATRRVDEAVTLASRGRLTAERQAYLSNAFDTRIKIAAKKAETLKSAGDTKGAETVRADLAANLAGEAQALGAVTTKDSAGSSDFLRVIVATSEDISGSGFGADALALDSGEDEQDAPVTMAKTARVGTTTPTLQKAARAPKLNHRLRVTATTTLRGKLDSSRATLFGLTSPVDVAIPQSQTVSAVENLLTTESEHSGDIKD